MKLTNWRKLKEELKTVFITADLGEGKTALSYHILENIKKYMPIWVFRHPKPKLIEKIGFKNMYDIDEIDNMNRFCLWLDEPQIVFPKYEKRGSIVLQKLLSLVRQKDMILIMSTSDTRYITSAEEFYISTYLIKRIDFPMIKRGSKIKQIVNDMKTITPEGYVNSIAKNEFIFYNKKLKELRGKYTFKLPGFFNEEYSKTLR